LTWKFSLFKIRRFKKYRLINLITLASS